MTDREALYRAVLESPDDDTLRLIYADALEEEGDARRAAFVRAQVEFAHLPDFDPARVHARYHDREKMFGARWVLKLPPLPSGLEWAREPFRRGFPADIRARDPAAFVSHADQLFRHYPIESLELAVARVTDVREFARCPWLSRLVRLSVAQGVGGQAAARLLDSDYYDRLRELHVGAGLTTASTATAIVSSRSFRQLTTLSCRDDQTGGRALVNELTRLADPPRLRNLDLSGNRLTAEQLGRLLRAPALSDVEQLILNDNNLGSEGMRVLSTIHLPQLHTIQLVRTRPEVQGVQSLILMSKNETLRSLSLGGNNLPPDTANILARAPLPGLRVLDLRDNRLGDAGAIALSQNAHLQNLVRLDLASNLVEDEGADALVASPNLSGLIHLDLHENVISPPAAARLKKRFGDRVLL